MFSVDCSLPLGFTRSRRGGRREPVVFGDEGRLYDLVCVKVEDGVEVRFGNAP